MTVRRTTLSEAKIRKALSHPEISELADLRYPLRLRLHKNRRGGSWYVVHYRAGKAHWHRLGTWPQIPAKQVIEALPAALAKLGAGAQSIHLGQLETVDQVLTWYAARTETNRTISADTRANTLSEIRRHLLPCLRGESLADLSADVVETELLWPLQARYAISYCRKIFATLQRALNLAARQQRLEHNPLAALKFGDFIDSPIKPKAARLRPAQLPDLLAQLNAAAPERALLAQLMLAYGTRVGETRRARWSHLTGECWHIPAAHTKTGAEHQLAITPLVAGLLARHRAHQARRGYRGDRLFPSGQGVISARTATDWITDLSAGQWSAHDLRKLARTIWADLGVDYIVAERLLNHALSKLDQTYIHSQIERGKAEALQRYHDHLIQQGLALQLRDPDQETQP